MGAVPAGLRAVQRGLRPHAACWWRAWLMDSWLARSLYRASPRLRARTGGVSREGVRLHTPPPPVAVGVGQAARRPPGQLWSSNRERQKSWRTAWLTFRCRARATCRPVLLLPPCVRLGACRVRRSGRATPRARQQLDTPSVRAVPRVPNTHRYCTFG